MTSSDYVKQKTRDEVRILAKQRAIDVAKTYTSAEVAALGEFIEQRKEAERLARDNAAIGGFPIQEIETFHYAFTDAVVSYWRTAAYRESMKPR